MIHINMFKNQTIQNNLFLNTFYHIQPMITDPKFDTEFYSPGLTIYFPCGIFFCH